MRQRVKENSSTVRVGKILILSVYIHQLNQSLMQSARLTLRSNASYSLASLRSGRACTCTCSAPVSCMAKISRLTLFNCW